MMCLLDFAGEGDMAGWIIGTDADDVRRQCEAALINSSDPSMMRLRDAAEWLYRNGYGIPAGKHELPSGHILLVS